MKIFTIVTQAPNQPNDRPRGAVNLENVLAELIVCGLDARALRHVTGRLSAGQPESRRRAGFDEVAGDYV